MGVQRRLIDDVLDQYEPLRPAPASQWVALPSGFSGARLWRGTVAGTPAVLRCWPAGHPQPQQLAWVHEQLVRSRQTGCSLLVAPLVTRSGSSFIESQGRLWEMTPWISGTSIGEDQATEHTIRLAMTALAQVHATLSTAGKQATPVRCVAERLRLFENYDRQPSLFNQALPQVESESLRRLLLRMLECAARQVGLLRRPPPIDLGTVQVCLRDVHADHVLFEHQRVRALIDYGAMNWDAPANDVVRLLGSWCRPGTPRWQAGIEAYGEQSSTRLSDDGLTWLYTTGLIGAAMNWTHWLAVERRSFQDQGAVERRLTWLVERLRGDPLDHVD